LQVLVLDIRQLRWFSPVYKRYVEEGPMIQRSLPMLGLTLALAMPLAADYSIDWYTIDGGGGTSTGGDFQVSGTIGQPDAGAATGGPYQLVGGFWAFTQSVVPPDGEVESDYFFIGSPADVDDEDAAEIPATETVQDAPESTTTYEIAEVRISFAHDADGWSLTN